jgi:hypothetical protein
MKLFESVVFQGEAGRHLSTVGLECEGRTFDVKIVPVGGAYTNRVVCVLCERELVAYENGLAPEPVWS